MFARWFAVPRVVRPAGIGAVLFPFLGIQPTATPVPRFDFDDPYNRFTALLKMVFSISLLSTCSATYAETIRRTPQLIAFCTNSIPVFLNPRD